MIGTKKRLSTRDNGRALILIRGSVGQQQSRAVNRQLQLLIATWPDGFAGTVSELLSAGPRSNVDMYPQFAAWTSHRASSANGLIGVAASALGTATAVSTARSAVSIMVSMARERRDIGCAQKAAVARRAA